MKSNIANTTPTKPKKLTKTAKIWIIAASVVVALLIGWLAYAAIVSNIEDRCAWFNNYCQGVFPFIKSQDESVVPTHRRGGSPPVEVLKPIIYLYPKTPTEVQVALGCPDKLTASYPKYETGWRVLAEPSGKLTDLNTGRELYSLYWEGISTDLQVTNEGFIVSGSETAEFLEEKLTILGLNAREAEEFIIYWLPKLQENNYNYIRFATSAEISDYMPLTVSPAPDNTIRILMLFSPLEQPISIQEQTLTPAPARTGFTVVEWGGSQV